MICSVLQARQNALGRVNVGGNPEAQALLVKFFKGERVADTKLSLPPPKFRV